jgi:hypothetical protein
MIVAFIIGFIIGAFMGVSIDRASTQLKEMKQ